MTKTEVSSPPSPSGPIGGCLCGGIRYRLAAIPGDVAHCHCRLCQRSAGALFVTWATVARADLTITSGAPRWYASSPRGRRGFCPTCGTQLFFALEETPTTDAPEPGTTEPDATEPDADEIDITVASLDEPDACRPTRNIWVGSRRALVHGFDGRLPDHLDEGPALD